MKRVLAGLAVLIALIPAAQASDGWVFYASSSGAQFFYNPSRIAGSITKRVWVRVEMAQAMAGGSRSFRDLLEVDCRDGKIRQLSSTSYIKPNLSGESLAREEARPWTYPPPNSPLELLFSLVCK
jgi:hypothetical protein